MKTPKTKTFTMPDGEVVEYTESSGNVFADLGLPDADELLLKAQLSSQIATLIEQKGLSHARAAELVGLAQSEVSTLLRGRLPTCSVEQLLHVLNRLGHDVEIRIRPEERAPDEARIRVLAA